MTKHLRYLTRITKLSWIKILSYPGNFLAFLSLRPLFLTLEFLSIYFIFYAGNISHIFGYSVYEVMFVSSLCVFIYQICGLGTIVNDEIEQAILTGKADMYLLKPLSFIFQLSFKEIYTEGFFILLERGSMALLMGYLGGLHFSFIELCAIGFIIISSTILQSLLLLLAASSSLFFPTSTGTLQEFLLTLIQSTQEFPKEIYPQWFQKLGISLLPIFLITNPTFAALKHSYTIDYALYTLLICGIFLLLTMWSWKVGMRKYQSAN